VHSRPDFLIIKLFFLSFVFVSPPALSLQIIGGLVVGFIVSFFLYLILMDAKAWARSVILLVACVTLAFVGNFYGYFAGGCVARCCLEENWKGTE
jgi:hypothetical protein